MADSAEIPGLAGVPLARGRAKDDPYRIKLSAEDEQDFVSWLIQEIRAGEEARTKVIQEHGLIDYWHELYEQTPQDMSVAWPDAANLSSWLPVEKVDALRARLTQIVFGPSPICAVEGYGESQERCGKVEAFHEWKAKDEKLRTWFARAIHTGLIDYWHELYEQTPQDMSVAWPDAANLSSWLPVEKVDALRARLTQIVFGPSPICAVEGYGESQERCGKVEAFHEWKAKDEKLRTWFARAIHTGLIEGNGILECSERPLIRKFQGQTKVHAVTDEFGALQLDAKGLPTPKRGDDGHLEVCDEPECGKPAMTVHYSDQVAVCDGPQYRVLSMKDFLFLPGHARDGSEVWGFAKRVYLRLPELQQRETRGYYKQVDRLGTEGDREQREKESRQGLTIAPQQDQTAEKELWEVHLFHDIDGDGVEEWVIATLSTKHGVCVRLEHDSLRQVRYISVTPFPRADSVYGYSFVGHKLASVAEEHAALRNQIADRGALAVNAPIKRLKDGYWNPDDQPWGPNAVIEVARMDEIQQQVVSDVPQSTVFQKRDCEEAAERISGLNDQSVIGAGSPTQITATQVQQEAHASFVRIDEPVHHLQEAMAELYQLRNEIWRRSLLAQESGVAPNTSVLRGLQTLGLTMPEQGAFKFTHEDLTGHFSFVPKGSVETADIFRQREDFNQFLAVGLKALLQLSPGLAQQFQQNPKLGESLLQKALHLYRMTDLQSVLTTAGPPMPQQPGMPGMPPGMGAPPPGMGAPGGMPPGLAQLLQGAMGQGGPPVPGPPMPGPMAPGPMAPQ